VVAHGSMRIIGQFAEDFLSSRDPYRQKCPTTSDSDVRLSCSNQECWRNRPCVASPRAAALLWGNGALILQRVTEYHNAPPGLTAKSRRKSSIFSPGRAATPSRQNSAGALCGRLLYRCNFRAFSSSALAQLFLYPKFSAADPNQPVSLRKTRLGPPTFFKQ
jgi:hypothetical protein